MGTRYLACLLLVPLLGAGCTSGTRDAREGPGSSPSLAVVTPSAGSDRVALSLGHDGVTVAVRTTTEVTLVLGDRYRWTDPTAEGAPVEIAALASDAPEGAQFWEIHLSETGTVVLSSQGSPACRPTTPGCPDRDRTYTVTLQIER